MSGLEKDIKKKLISITGDCEAQLIEDPIIMLETIKLVAETNFDIAKDTYEVMLKNAALLGKPGKNRIRDAFGDIMEAEFAGKGLKMIVGCGLLPYIIGMSVAEKVGRRELTDMETLAAGIGNTKLVRLRRLGMFYLCFEKDRALKAIEYLNYDIATRQTLIDGVTQQEKLYFMAKKEDLKDFLAEYGFERYNYIHNLAKAYAIVFDTPNIKIKNRIYMYEEIINNKEPIYIEDLAITEADLAEEGIAEGEKAQEILKMLTDVVHRKPRENTEEALLVYAKRFSKNKISAALRKVHWLK